jgi:hypothetical protein
MSKKKRATNDGRPQKRETALSRFEFADSACPFSFLPGMGGNPMYDPEAESDDNHKNLLAKSQRIIAEVFKHRNHLLSSKK